MQLRHPSGLSLLFGSPQTDFHMSIYTSISRRPVFYWDAHIATEWCPTAPKSSASSPASGDCEMVHNTTSTRFSFEWCACNELYQVENARLAKLPKNKEILRWQTPQTIHLKHLKHSETRVIWRDPGTWMYMVYIVVCCWLQSSGLLSIARKLNGFHMAHGFTMFHQFHSSGFSTLGFTSLPWFTWRFMAKN